MEIVFLASVVFASASILTLKSMKEFVHEALSGSGEILPMYIIETNDQIYEVLNTVLKKLPYLPGGDIVIEKINLPQQSIVVIYTAKNLSIWGKDPLPGFEIENGLSSDNRYAVLAHQLIVRHGFQQKAYITVRSIKAVNGSTSGSTAQWEEFLSQKHCAKPQTIQYDNIYKLVYL